MDFSQIPVFILAGGFGTRLKEHTAYKPKPMIEIGGKPILWHLMRWYRKFGFKNFVICAGYKSEIIREYFLNYHALNNDFSIDLSSQEISYYNHSPKEDWKVTIAFTGVDAMTGARVGRATQKYLGDAKHFAVTYGDGLSDVNLTDACEFHINHGCVGTVLAINQPQSRFGMMKLDAAKVDHFIEKPETSSSVINGGFFFFKREFTNYLSTDANLILENEPIRNLVKNKQLMAYKHDGFWACMDTQRDKDNLEDIWQTGNAPWSS